MERDVVVIGGGLAGLAAAALSARGGARVTLIERAPSTGGRAASHARGGFLLNQGPHALYRGGAAEEVLRALGVAYVGHPPPTSGAFGLDGGALHTLPTGFLSLLSTGLLGLSGKLQGGRLLARLGAIAPERFAGRTLSSWLDETVRDAALRRFVEALARVATYADAADRIDAPAALAQVKRAIAPGVLYLDGGWQSLVDGLSQAARAAGVELRASCEAEAIDENRGVRLANGERIAARAVIVAGSPSLAKRLLPSSAAARAAAETSIPVEAACLDLALARLPHPRRTFALGIDRPLYCSVHSAAARLAPDGGAVIHAAKYLAPGGAADARGDERELEELVDLLQPGWRDAIVERRFLPKMVVYHRLPRADENGLAGRPSPSLPDAPGVFVCGDWVGAEGMLADAALASAREAAALATAALAEARRGIARSA